MSWFVACKSPRPSSYLLSVLVSGGCGVSCNGFLTRSICQSLCPSLDQCQPLSHLGDQSHTCPSPSPLPPIFNSTFFIIRHLLNQPIRSDTGVVYKNTFPEYFMSSDVLSVSPQVTLYVSWSPWPVAGPNDGSLHLNIVTTGSRGWASGSQKTAKINIYTPDNICHLF